MRISDWSSDVCSSDLDRAADGAVRADGLDRLDLAGRLRRGGLGLTDHAARERGGGRDAARARKSVVLGKSVSVGVDLGGRRIRKKKNTKHLQSRQRSNPQ